MVLFLALCLLADGGPPPEGVELTVYRAASELPVGWVKLLPKDFDFSREMLATRARPGERLAWMPARLEPHGADVYLWPAPPPAEEPRECPPCRGVHTEDRVLQQERAFPSPAVVSIFRVPRGPGKVFLLPALAELVPRMPRCPPCLAP